MSAEETYPLNIIVSLCLFTLLPGVHRSSKTQLLILLRGISSERLCSWIKMSALTVQWLGMSSLQSKCIKLVWLAETHSGCYRGMKDSWCCRERWPYWFKSVYKLKLMAGKWMDFTSLLFGVFQAITSNANQIIHPVKAFPRYLQRWCAVNYTQSGISLLFLCLSRIWEE